MATKKKTTKSNVQYVRTVKAKKPATRTHSCKKTTKKKSTTNKTISKSKPTKSTRKEPVEIKRYVTRDGNVLLIMREYSL